jgi:hypothetical protein
MKQRNFPGALFFVLLITSLAFAFFFPSLLKIPETGLKAQPVPTLTFFSTIIPNIGQHIIDAQNAGYPAVLTRITNKPRIDKNRREACKNFVPIPPLLTSCDEYPFASSQQGGVGASIRAVPLTEQAIQGGHISVFYRVNGITNGTQFRVQVL